jgi:ribosomal protein L14
MKKILIAIILSIPVMLNAQTTAATTIAIDTAISTTVPEGTIIKAALLKDISGKEVSVGQNVDFELIEDLILNNKVAIPKGAKIVGAITEAQRSKAMGKKGKLAFSIDYMYLENGKVVKLRSQVEKNLKGSGAAVAAGAIFLSPVALLFNGKNATYQKGDIFTAYIDKETKL